MGAAGGLTGAGPPAESAPQISSSNWSPLSRRALNRKPCPTIEAQNGTCFPSTGHFGKVHPILEANSGSHFPQPLQQRLGPSRFPKAGNRKVVAHQQRTLDQHAVGRQQLVALPIPSCPHPDAPSGPASRYFMPDELKKRRTGSPERAIQVASSSAVGLSKTISRSIYSTPCSSSHALAFLQVEHLGYSTNSTVMGILRI